MEFLTTFTDALKFGLINMAWAFTVLWGVERLWPKDRPPERVQLASLRFWAFYAVGGATIVTVFGIVKDFVDLRPLIVLPLGSYVPGWSAYVIAPLATSIVYDFWNYWMHRAQHKWFWAQHSIHHSIRELSAVNSYMHWTEDLFRIAFIAVPSALIFNIEIGGATLAATILTALNGNFIHSASSVHFGKTGRLLLVDNRWHRIHHSIEPQHFDRNFGTFTTLWDRLFRTAHFPENHEWPATGVHDMSEVATVREYLWRPFLRRGSRAEVGHGYNGLGRVSRSDTKHTNSIDVINEGGDGLGPNLSPVLAVLADVERHSG